MVLLSVLVNLDIWAGRMKIMIVDEHDIFCKGLEKILADEPDIEVAQCCGMPWEKALIKNRPDIVIIDVCLEDVNPFELIRRVLNHSPGIKFMVLTHSELESDLVSSFEVGVSAYLSKSTDTKSLIHAIHRVYQGEIIISHPSNKDMIAKMVTGEVKPDTETRPVVLTRKEQVILSMVEQGNTNQDIAEALIISPHTVKVHMRNIMEKLRAPTRQRAAFLAREQGLLDKTD